MIHNATKELFRVSAVRQIHWFLPLDDVSQQADSYCCGLCKVIWVKKASK